MATINQRCDSMLGSYRVLDLADEKGYLCGKILSDLGADVMKIEKPGGDNGRSIGPFYHDIPDPEKSLYWFAYNANKLSISLNIESYDGQKIFKRLVKTSDIVVESYPVGYLDRLGLGYSTLSELNAGIILVSITPFGQTGPYKDCKTSDLVSVAMGGLMFITGYPDSPPVRISFPQAYLQAGAEAAAGAMIALYHREITGQGQWVDVSIQQSQVVTCLNAPPSWELRKVKLKRAGHFRTGLMEGLKQRYLWPCKDGYVIFHVYGGATGAKTNRVIVDWMSREGMADDFIKEMDWDTFTPSDQETQERIEASIARFFMTHTQRELFEAALTKGIMLGPVVSPKDVVENEQLRARGVWVELEHPELDTTLTYPGAFFKSTECECQARCRAPLIGEHNEAIYSQLGFSKEDLVALKASKII